MANGAARAALRRRRSPCFHGYRNPRRHYADTLPRFPPTDALVPLLRSWTRIARPYRLRMSNESAALLRGVRVLIVEDHDDTRESLDAQLTLSGALVLTAPTALEALS